MGLHARRCITTCKILPLPRRPREQRVTVPRVVSSVGCSARPCSVSLTYSYCTRQMVLIRTGRTSTDPVCCADCQHCNVRHLAMHRDATPTFVCECASACATALRSSACPPLGDHRAATTSLRGALYAKGTRDRIETGNTGERGQVAAAVPRQAFGDSEASFTIDLVPFSSQ